MPSLSLSSLISQQIDRAAAEFYSPLESGQWQYY